MNTTLLYAGYQDGRFEWLHGQHVIGSRYIIATVPLEGTAYSFCDLVEVRLSRGTPYIARILKPSNWRTVRFNRAALKDPRFKSRALQIDALECIIEWTDHGNGSIAYQAPVSRRLGRLLRQMEEERLLRLLNDIEPGVWLAEEGIA